MIFKQFMFTGMSNNMSVKHQCITPMFNIHVEEDIKMKHFSIFKIRSMQEIQKLGVRIEETRLGVNVIYGRRFHVGRVC